MSKCSHCSTYLLVCKNHPKFSDFKLWQSLILFTNLQRERDGVLTPLHESIWVSLEAEVTWGLRLESYEGLLLHTSASRYWPSTQMWLGFAEEPFITQKMEVVSHGPRTWHSIASTMFSLGLCWVVSERLIQGRFRFYLLKGW